MESELSNVAPVEWQRLSIEAVCKRVTSGGTPSRRRPEFYIGGKWNWIKTQELKDTWIDQTEEHITDEAIAESSAKPLPPKTVLLALYGATVGQLGILRTEMTCNQACCAMIVDPSKADYRFLVYQLLVSRSQLKRLAIGAAQQNLSGQLIKSYKLPFPPLCDQQAIACILGSLDDKIELNRQMNRTLEEMAQAIFKSWFVDFDPVRAKAAGLPPPGLKPEIAALFPDSFEDSEVGEIPKGWRVASLSELTTLITKGTTPTQEDVISSPNCDSLVNYVRANCIEEDGSILEHKLLCIPLSVHNGVLKRSILKSGDILYTIAGTIGRIALVEDWILPANTNQAIAIIRPASQVPPGFLLFTMRQDRFCQHLHINIVHAVQANLSLGVLAKAKGVIPEIPKLPKLCSPIEAILFRIINNRTQSRTLAAIRDTLLPKLISGELRVKDAERIVGRCV